MTDQQTVKGQRPPPTAGMRHVALFVSDFKAACFFYIELLGMAIEWQPDEDNIFLCSGNDNVALHNKPDNVNLDPAFQQLDHIGFILDIGDSFTDTPTGGSLNRAQAQLGKLAESLGQLEQLISDLTLPEYTGSGEDSMTVRRFSSIT